MFDIFLLLLHGIVLQFNIVRNRRFAQKSAKCKAGARRRMNLQWG